MAGLEDKFKRAKGPGRPALFHRDESLLTSERGRRAQPVPVPHLQMSEENIRVIGRFRPYNEREEALAAMRAEPDPDTGLVCRSFCRQSENGCCAFSEPAQDCSGCDATNACNPAAACYKSAPKKEL